MVLCCVITLTASIHVCNYKFTMTTALQTVDNKSACKWIDQLLLITSIQNGNLSFLSRFVSRLHISSNL